MNYDYVGYGYVVSNKNINDILIKSTKAYKALSKALLTDIIIEAGALDSRRYSLYNFINKNIYEKKFNIVLVIPTIETLASTIDDIAKRYDYITEYFHIIILNRPDLSTIDLNGNVIVEIYDKDRRKELTNIIACSRVSNRGRKATPINEQFRKVFWAWQNYYIDNEDAIRLLGISRPRLYSLSTEFMTSSNYREMYKKDFKKYMKNFEDKAVRGVTIDNNTRLLIGHIRSKCGIDWTVESVQQVLSETTGFVKEYCAEDYIRLKLNYMFGRAAIFEAIKKYKKKPEYVKQLADELSKITVELKKEDG